MPPPSFTSPESTLCPRHPSTPVAMYVEKRGRGRKRAREEDGQVTEAGQREASSRVGPVDPSAHEQLPEEDLMEWYEETMKMEEEDVGVCLTNAELASRGHPPQLDGAKQNQLDGEKLVAKSQGGRPKGTVEHIELPNGWEVRYKIRNTGLGKGKRSPDRYFVSPEGTFLRSKRELMAHLYLNILGPWLRNLHMMIEVQAVRWQVFGFVLGRALAPSTPRASTSRKQPRASAPRKSGRFCAGVAK